MLFDIDHGSFHRGHLTAVGIEEDLPFLHHQDSRGTLQLFFLQQQLQQLARQGRPAAFLQAQADLLAGKTGFSIEDPGIRSIACADISADSYVADSVRIGKGAVLRHACVLEDAVIGPGAHIDSAIICPRARVGRGAELHKDSVLGAGSALGDFGHLTAGASVWPGIMLPASAAVTENVRQREPVTVCQGKGQAFFPAQQAQLCGAFLQEASVRTLAVMQDGRSAAAYHTVLGALTAYGAERVWMLGRGTVGMLAHAVNALHAQGGLLCRADGFLLLDQNGLPLNSKVSARVEATALRQELPALAPGSTVLRAHASLRADYLRFLAQAFVCEKGARVSLLCKDRFLRAAAKQAFSLAGHTLAGDGIPLVLEEEHARLLLASRELTPLQQWLLYAHALQAEGLPVYDSQDWGWTGEGILPCDGSEACITQQRWRQDGLAQALILLQLFARETPEEALLSLPEAVHSALDIPCHPEEKGHVLESLLADAAPRPQGGLAAVRGNARAVIRPDPVLPLLHISAFARDTEHARELCDFYAGKVRSALHERL